MMLIFKELKLFLTVESMMENLRMERKMVKELEPGRMEASMSGNGRMGKGPTITACSLPDDYVHYKQARSITVREWARLQTFPDWYQFAGKRTTGGTRRAGNPRTNNFKRDLPKYTQIGNAVPVKLAFEIGEHFKSILNRK